MYLFESFTRFSSSSLVFYFFGSESSLYIRETSSLPLIRMQIQDSHWWCLPFALAYVMCQGKNLICMCSCLLTLTLVSVWIFRCDSKGLFNFQVNKEFSHFFPSHHVFTHLAFILVYTVRYRSHFFSSSGYSIVLTSLVQYIYSPPLI